MRTIRCHKRIQWNQWHEDTQSTLFSWKSYPRKGDTLLWTHTNESHPPKRICITIEPDLIINLFILKFIWKSLVFPSNSFFFARYSIRFAPWFHCIFDRKFYWRKKKTQILQCFKLSITTYKSISKKNH